MRKGVHNYKKIKNLKRFNKLRYNKDYVLFYNFIRKRST